MTDYRSDDESRGYCPTCGRQLAALDVAGRGVCEEHGRVFADWDAKFADWLTRHGERGSLRRHGTHNV